jgi:general secretion pathway protein I
MGFTLVEVMVALLVVAVAISALLNQMIGNIDNSAYLRDKTIAQWVALNQLELIYLENQNTNELPDDESSGTSQMAGREWYWLATPKETAADGFIQIDVSVREDADDESAIVTVTGVLDSYYCPSKGCE